MAVRLLGGPNTSANESWLPTVVEMRREGLEVRQQVAAHVEYQPDAVVVGGVETRQQPLIQWLERPLGLLASGVDPGQQRVVRRGAGRRGAQLVQQRAQRPNGGLHALELDAQLVGHDLEEADASTLQTLDRELQHWSPGGGAIDLSVAVCTYGRRVLVRVAQRVRRQQRQRVSLGGHGGSQHAPHFILAV